MAKFSKTDTGDTMIVDDEGDRLIFRASDRKGYIVLAIAGKAQNEAPCVEIKVDWLFRGTLETVMP